MRGHRHTKPMALRTVEDLDADPVYLSTEEMIHRIITEHQVPEQQIGEAVVFKRRKPHENRIPELFTLQALYDFIRMIDAENYLQAFLEYAGFSYDFTHAALYNGRVEANRLQMKRNNEKD